MAGQRGKARGVPPRRVGAGRGAPAQPVDRQQPTRRRERRGGDSDSAVASAAPRQDRPAPRGDPRHRRRSACSPRCGSPGSRAAIRRTRRGCATWSPSATRAIPARCARRGPPRQAPTSCQIVVGDPAPASELRRRWQQAGGDSGQTTGLADFVARQATLALERAERRLRGSRYKVPRFVYEDILGRPAFRGGVARIAAELGSKEDVVAAEGGGLFARDRRHAQSLRHRPHRASHPSAGVARLLRRALRPAAARAPVRTRPAPSAGVPADAQVEPRPPRPPVRPARERPPAQPHRRRHQHELLPGRTVGAALGRLLHPPDIQGQPALQVRAPAVPRLPDREALHARVVSRGRSLALRQAAAAAVRAVRQRRRRLPAAQERRCAAHPGGDRLRPDPGRRRLRRRAARRGQAEGEPRLVPAAHPPPPPQLRRHPRPLRRAAVARPGRWARRRSSRRAAPTSGSSPCRRSRSSRPCASIASRRSRQPR